MGKFGRAMGREGLASVMSAASQIGGDIRKYSEKKREDEEQASLENIRVPVPGASFAGPEQATSTTLKDALATKQAEAESPLPQEDVAGKMQEQAVATEAFEANRKQAEEQKDEEVVNVEELPMIKGLEDTPTAKNRLLEIANVNGWIQNVGGVATISRKQMRIAQGIISNDLQMNKEINELALGDITQKINGWKQSLLDPKMKDEERAQVGDKIDQGVLKQEQVLNAVNMMDKEIRKGLALRQEAGQPNKPFKTKTEPLGKGMFQDHERIGGEWKPFGKPYKKGEASKGWGATEWNSYRQYLKQAETNSYRALFANDETIMQKIALLDTDISEEEKASIEAKIHRDLTPTQRVKLDELTEKYLAGKTPKPMLDEWLSAKKRGEAHEVISNPLKLVRQPRT